MCRVMLLKQAKMLINFRVLYPVVDIAHLLA